jgi:formate-dependent nitrite reductase membrane component NrfD
MLSGQPLVSPPWGDDLAAYFILIGLASGITLLAGWVDAGRGRSARFFELWASGLSLGILALVGVVLIADLGRPSRFWLMLGAFSNLESPMAWGAKLIGLKCGLLSLHLYLVRRRVQLDPDSAELAHGLTRFTFRSVHGLLQAISLALAIYPAFLLSRTWLSPLASTPGGALLFLTTALLLGAAALLLLDQYLPAVGRRRQLTRAIGYLLMLEGVTLAFEGGLAHQGREWLDLSQAQATLFWGVVVTIGLAIPALIRLAVPSSARVTAANATAIALGAATARYLLFTVR